MVNYKYIILTQGKQALVDDEDYEWLSQWKWSYANTGYAKRNSLGKTYLMHREVMHTKNGLHTDHRNFNRLDNRKANLRICRPASNTYHHRVGARNKTGFVGVSKVTLMQNRRTPAIRWIAQINHNKKHYHLGYYFTPEEAALAYNKKAKQLFREYATLNKI